MKQFLNEPLLHFLVLGAAIFAAYGWVSKHISDEPGNIVITEGQVASMMTSFTRTWQRPPTSDELEGLIRDGVREEVYYREALALGLDKDDIIIRRRLRQKMEFVTNDVAAQTEPTEAELSAYLTAHPNAFRVQRQFTFSHVYLNPEHRGENLAHDTAQLLARLHQAGNKADISTLGDPFPLERTFAAVQGSEIARQFGERFAAQLGELSPGQWHGPVKSAHGVHLVFISERTDGRMPALAEVRDVVRREWANGRRLEANERFYQELLRRYAVTVERPQTVAREGLQLK